MYADAVGPHVVYRIRKYGGVAVAARVVEVHQQILVLVEILLVELGAAEKVDRLLVRLLERLAQTLVRETVVARECYLADLHLGVAVDAERDVGHVVKHRVVLDDRSDTHVAESLVDEVLLDEFLVLVDNVVREFGIALELELLDQILLLAAADAVAHDHPVAHARTLFQKDLQIDAVALDRGADLHVGETTLAPQTRDGVRDVVAGQIYAVARNETRRRTYEGGIQILYSANVYLADAI